jgi:hypothetical protein
VIPPAAATLATLAIEPLAAAISGECERHAPPEGSVGITMPAPCSNATVVLPLSDITARRRSASRKSRSSQ